MTLTLHQLDIVRIVFDTSSVTETARILGVTQPAVSYQLKQAERILGGLLFYRRYGSLQATPAAERLVQATRLIFDELHKAERDVRDILVGKRGMLYLSTVCTTAYHWLPEVLTTFRETHPDVEIVIDSSRDRTPVEAVERGDLDIALTTEIVQRKGMISTPLFDDEIVGLVSPDHRLARKSFLTADDLKEETVFSYDYRNSDIYRHLLLPAGINPERVLDVDATESMLAMVKVGIGVGAAARWTVQPEIEAGQVRALRLSRKGIIRKWWAVSFDRAGAPPYVGHFVMALKTYSKRMTPMGRR